MTTRFVRKKPNTTIVQGGGVSFATITLICLFSLIIIAIAVLIIIHVTVGGA